MIFAKKEDEIEIGEDMDLVLHNEDWRHFVLRCCRMLAFSGSLKGKSTFLIEVLSFSSSMEEDLSSDFLIKTFEEGTLSSFELSIKSNSMNKDCSVLDIIETDDSGECSVIRHLVVGAWR